MMSILDKSLSNNVDIISVFENNVCLTSNIFFLQDIQEKIQYSQDVILFLFKLWIVALK